MAAGGTAVAASASSTAPGAGPGAALSTAPGTTAEATAVEPGRIVQEDPPLRVIASPEAGSATLRFRATVPAGVTGPLKTRITLPITNWPPAGWTDYRVAALITSACSVAGTRLAPCSWAGTTLSEEEEGPARVVLDLPATEAEPLISYLVDLELHHSLDWLGNLDAPVELRSADGTVVSRGTVRLEVVGDSPSPFTLGAVYGRDKEGVLWRYEAKGLEDRKLTPRTRVGGGWNVYERVVPLTRMDARNMGELVAQDKQGHLWYYRGTAYPGAPFKPRVPLGDAASTEWKQYTALAANGRGGLVARDRDGVLWNYEKSSQRDERLKPRVRVGGGWNAYDLITGYADGLVARDRDGVLWKYNATTAYPAPYRPFDARWRVGGGWKVYNAVAGTKELGRWSRTDLLARETNGDLWAYDSAPSGFGYATTSIRRRIGWGWNIYDLVI
ncbi:hypothetical protein BU197_15825 [Streptomyces sp. CBMA291]|nr:hypothetical protein [Streptomyces sp. CBMA291]